MDRYQICVGLAYIVSLVVAFYGFYSTKKDDTSPVWCLWVASIIAGIAAYSGITYCLAPMNVVSGTILYVVLPILLAWTGILGLGYAKKAAFDHDGVGIFGWKGATSAPAGATDPWKQGDVAFLILTASLISIGIAIWLSWNSLLGLWNTLPEPTQRPATEQTVEIAKKLEAIRGQKPLKASSRPFAITLYPQEFPTTDFSQSMKNVFNTEIADLNIGVKEFIQLRVEEVDGSIDLIGHFSTEPLVAGGTVPPGNERMTVRIQVETPSGVDAWVQEQVLPRTQALYDDAEARGLTSAPAMSVPSIGKPRSGVTIPPPVRARRIGVST